MKKIALVLVLVLALLICGCTPTTNNPSETTAPNSGSTETTAPNSDNTETTGPNSDNTETTGPGSDITPDTSAHTNHCVCGGATVHTAAAHTCADTTYTALDTATLTAMIEDPAAEIKVCPIQGNYYLTENIDIDARLEFVGDLSICLNGFELKFRDTRGDNEAQVTGFKIDISDCSANKAGKFTSTVKQTFFASANTALPLNISVWGGTVSNTATNGVMGLIFTLGEAKGGVHTLNIYNGTIIGGPVSNQGGVMRLSKGTVCNIYGGTITGGTATSTAEKSALGGNIYMFSDNTEVNIYGGTVTGGTAAVGSEAGSKTAQGGNIYVSSGTLTLYGGSVSGGKAVGGSNIMVAGGNVKIVGVDAETKITVGSGITPDVSDLNSNTTVTNEGIVYTATKTGA